jgi:predicted nucleic acid-binding protein
MLILLDTNMLLRVVEPGHVQHARALQILRSYRQAGHELCLVPQNHYEFWVVATRPIAQNGLGMTTADAETQLEKLAPLFRLLRDEPAIYEPWRELVSKLRIEGKQAHDARFVAAMQRHSGKLYLLLISPILRDIQAFN